MNCRDVDELAAAYALGAVEADEERAIGAHLQTCPQPHDEARSFLAAAGAMDAAVEPVMPSPNLRARVLATAAATPQEHAARPRVTEPTAAPSVAARRPWWQLGALPAAVAAVALAVAVGLGAWNVSLGQQLADREAALRAVAAADAAYQVGGSAGSGWVLETDGEALFLAENLAELPADRIYELWLIGSDGVPVAVGVLDEAGGLTAVTLERELGGAQVFAVTVEANRVESPTSDPVLVAQLET